MRSTTLSAIVLALAAFASPALAKPDLDAERAETYAGLGMRLAAQGQYGEALVEFRRAEHLIDHVSAPGVLYGNIGYCLVQLGRQDEALAAFEEGLRRAGDDAIKARLQAQITELEKALFSSLSVRCDVPEATVSIPGRDAFPCPATWGRLRAGRYLVEGSTADGLVAVREVDVTIGEPATVALRFPAALWIEGDAPGRVLIDGERVGKLPFETTRLVPGVHAIEVIGPDGGRWREQLDAKPGAWHRLTARPLAAAVTASAPVAEADTDIWLWTGIGLGAAAVVGVGVYLIVSGLDETEPRDIFVIGGE